MSIDSEYQTFVEIQDAVIADSKVGEGERENVKRWINEGYMDLITRRKREFLNSTVNYLTEEDLQGDCTVTNGSATVSWDSTSTTLVSSSGSQYKFFIGGTQEIYDVTAVGTSTITLAVAYVGESSTSTVGTLVQASFNISDTIKSVAQVDHDYFSYPVSQVGPQELMRIKDSRGRQVLGYATHATVDQKTSATESRLYLYPYPDHVYNIKLNVSLYPNRLEDDDDEPLIFSEYRCILYYYALAKSFEKQRNMQWYQMTQANYMKWLTRLDSELKPRDDEPSLVYNYTNRFITPFINYRNSNRARDDD